MQIKKAIKYFVFCENKIYKASFNIDFKDVAKLYFYTVIETCKVAFSNDGISRAKRDFEFYIDNIINQHIRRM